MDLIQRLTLSVLRYPEHEFLVDGGLRLTFAEWDRRINRAARAFRALGIGREDHVVLALRNREELVTSWYGLMKLEAIATPINHRLSRGEIPTAPVARKGDAALFPGARDGNSFGSERASGHLDRGAAIRYGCPYEDDCRYC